LASRPAQYASYIERDTPFSGKQRLLNDARESPLGPGTPTAKTQSGVTNFIQPVPQMSKRTRTQVSV